MSVICYTVVSILVLAYGNGYRVRFAPFAIARTGNALITFVPTDAQVTIDGRSVGTSSPIRERAIFPGTHAVRISRASDIPFMYTFRTEPLETSFISDVFLFKKDDAVFIASSTHDLWSAAPPKLATTTPVLIAGKNISVSHTPDKGYVLMIDSTPVGHDLGGHAWRVVGGDATLIGLTHDNSGEIEFHPWSHPDDIALRVSGTNIVTQTYNGTDTLIVYSSFEVWHVNPRAARATLITRVSTPIHALIAPPQTTTALVMTEHELLGFSLSVPDAAPITLAHGTQLTDATLATDNQSVVFTDIQKNVATRWRRTLFD